MRRNILLGAAIVGAISVASGMHILACSAAAGDGADIQGACKALLDDGNDCTDDVCSLDTGEVEHLAFPRDTPCKRGKNHGTCDDKKNCILLCGAPGNECKCTDKVDCEASGICWESVCSGDVCSRTNAGPDTFVNDGKEGNCTKYRCDGNGNHEPVLDDTDPEIKPDAPCETDECVSMSVTDHNPIPTGDSCKGDSTRVCDTGSCVECVVATNTGCDPATKACQLVDGEAKCVSCIDVVKNGDETDTDCGGSCAKCDSNSLWPCKLCAEKQGCGNLDANCTNGKCADGFCCNNSCDDACHSCNQQGYEGLCQPLPGGQPDPQAGLCGGNQVCSANGNCTSKGAYGAQCNMDDNNCASDECVANVCKLNDGSVCDPKEQECAGYCKDVLNLGFGVCAPCSDTEPCPSGTCNVGDGDCE